MFILISVKIHALTPICYSEVLLKPEVENAEKQPVDKAKKGERGRPNQGKPISDVSLVKKA